MVIALMQECVQGYVLSTIAILKEDAKHTK